MARTLIVSDRYNSFFTTNKIRVGNQLPTEGNYVKGDIIVNIGNSTATEAMWICVESGNPGVWEVVGAGAGAGAGSLVSINDSVFVNEPVNEVSLTGLGVGVSSKDKLMVHHNSVHLMEGVDYEISKDGTKIVKLTEGNWNEDSEENALFAFELFKYVESVEGDKIVVGSKLTSITNHVILGSGVSEVEIGIKGFNAGNDMMLVFKNGVNMVEGVDYEVQSGKIVSTGEVWNENGLEDYGMTFVVFKEVVEYNGEAEVKAENIVDGSIGMDKLADDVKGAIEAAGNIDLSRYATKEEMNGKVAQGDYNTKIAELEGRVEEAFTSANNGKQLIASAIGEPLNSNDTFSAMSDKINDIKSDLKQVLIEEGVSVTEKDDMASLITKVDSEFNDKNNEITGLNNTINTQKTEITGLNNTINTQKTEITGLNNTITTKNNEINSLNTNVTLLTNQVNSLTSELAGKVTPTGTAVAANVLSGKTFINSTGQVVTGTMTDRGGAQTVTPGTSNKTLNAGYYSGNITVAGDADLVPANIVSGKNIFGVAGTATASSLGGVKIVAGTDYTLATYNSGEVSKFSATTYVKDSGTYSIALTFVGKGYTKVSELTIRAGSTTVYNGPLDNRDNGNGGYTTHIPYYINTSVTVNAGDTISIYFNDDYYDNSISGSVTFSLD